jgi:hypothetical protein
METQIMDFEAYCTSKKIDANAFKSADQALYQTLQTYFEAVGPVSFTQQKLFLINQIRRNFPWKKPETVEVTESIKTTAGISKPTFKPKF